MKISNVLKVIRGTKNRDLITDNDGNNITFGLSFKGNYEKISHKH